MTEACLLSPPVGADRIALQAHLQELQAMNTEDPLIQIAIEDAEGLLQELSTS